MTVSWELRSLVEGVIDSLLSYAGDIAVEEFINQVGIAELLEQIGDEGITEHIGDRYEPEDVFTREELDNWADEVYGFEYMEEVRNA